jgi:mannose/cellobiose epimerase-like protein (N-acyl-D-glucosamine 2-epimerase family)
MSVAVPRPSDFRDPDFLRAHIRHTLAFYDPVCVDPTGGFFHFFKDDGAVYDRVSRHLVSSTRFVFNHAMALRHLGEAERPQDRERVRHGLAFLARAHALPDGGHAWTLDWRDGSAVPTDTTLHAYGQAFVLLAHAHALMAGVSEARAGLDATVAFMEARFWEETHGLYADEIPPGRAAPTGYRGQNANMHACEAMLAAHEATGEPWFLARALRLAEGVTRTLSARAGGLPWEHYRADWTPDGDYNRGDRTNIFRPWGYQTGHLTEWTKLLCQLAQRLGPAATPDWLAPTAERFFAVAMARGWDAVHGGLVYGFGPDGSVCDDDKYFWVGAESLAAAAGLVRLRRDRAAQGLPAVAPAEDVAGLGALAPAAQGVAAAVDDPGVWYERLWDHAWRHLIDHRHGAWYRIRTRDHRPYSDEKSPAGKTDYHTMGACWDVLRFQGALAGGDNLHPAAATRPSTSPP